MKDTTKIRLNSEACQEKCNNAEISKRQLAKQRVDTSAPQYVDGGYGWLIVLSCFLQTMIMDGSINSFGVIYLEVTEKFGASSSEAAWILSLQTCMRGLVGPLVIALKEFLGCRIVTIAGSLLIALGMFSSAFASSVAHLYITFGVIAGVGFGVYQQIGMALVNHFFDKRRGFANGISTSGTGIGLVVFPPLTNYLFSKYGFSSTCMFLAGIALLGVIAGALIITPEAALKLQSNKSQDKKGVDNKAFSMNHENDEKITYAYDSILTENELKEPKETDPLTRKNTGDLQHKTFCQTLKAAFNFKLFKDYKYTFFNLTHSIFSSCMIISPAFMPARAVSYGISKSNGSLLISIMGLSSLLTRPAMGFIVDVQPIKAKRFYMFFASALLAGSFSLVSFGPTLTAQMFYASLYGITTGSYISMLTMTLGDLIGVQSLMSGFGMQSLSVIVPTLLFPAAAGFIFDKTGRYEYVFAFSGSMLILASVMTILIPIIRAVKERKLSREDNP